MFRRHLPQPDEELPVFTKKERIAATIAHAAPLLCLSLFPLLGHIGFAILPSPVIAYVVSRSFRRSQSIWGAFQGMQATLVHLILVVLVFVFHFTIESAGGEGGIPSQVALVAFVSAFLLFLYTLWAAWDTAWGYDFRYIFISNFVDRITAANLDRQETRRRRSEAREPGNSPPPSNPPASNPPTDQTH